MHGKDASFKLNTHVVGEATDWTISASLDIADSSAMGDDWKSGVAGMASWSGSANMHFDLTDTYQAAVHDALVTASPTGSITTARFYVNASNYYSGSILITGVNPTAGIGDLVKLSVSFQGTGALSYT
jgi:predicted secreted protein